MLLSMSLSMSPSVPLSITEDSFDRVLSSSVSVFKPGIYCLGNGVMFVQVGVNGRDGLVLKELRYALDVPLNRIQVEGRWCCRWRCRWRCRSHCT